MTDDDPTREELADALAGMLVLAQLLGVPESDLSFELMTILRKRAEHALELVKRARGEGRYDRAALLAERDQLRAEVNRLREAKG